ncbi:MAG: HEPN domain-containing protein [Egibacteraceae bacterium]
MWYECEIWQNWRPTEATKDPDFPFAHDLDVLLRLVEEAGLEVPERVATVGLLTPYAAQTRYPGEWEEISDEELAAATHVAAEVLAWARSLWAVAEEQSDTTAGVDSRSPTDHDQP